jgi:serine/threonine protein kinase/tetratricopeptide (TPR) repeat protein
MNIERDQPPMIPAGDIPPQSSGEGGPAIAALFDQSAQRRQLGQYVVIGTLGRGGMGTVLEAFDRTLDRRVAIKVLHRDIDGRHQTRLLREAQALAKLSHPNVVQVYEAGNANDQMFIALEYVRGQTLKEWQEQKNSWKQCVEVYLQAGRGLAAAHACGLIHRDFKPGNVIIDKKGHVKVLDFGLVRDVGIQDLGDVSAAPSSAIADNNALQAQLTQTGTVLGTIAYMPPEQLSGEPSDARSDQFSLCVALYEALYGERPFAGRTVMELRLALMHGAVRAPPKDARVPARLRRVLLRGLAPRPDDRWPSLDHLLEKLTSIIRPPRTRWVLAVGLTVLALGVGLGRQPWQEQKCKGGQDQLVGIWDDERRVAVESAMLSTGLPYADDTWARVRRRLDEYSDAWLSKHMMICQATYVSKEQSEEDMDLRMQCLSNQRIALAEVVTVLEQADAQVVREAVKLTTDLPILTECNHVERLKAIQPADRTPQQAKGALALRGQLARAKALYGAGKYEQSLTETEIAVEQAKRLNDPYFMLEARLIRGYLRDSRGEYDEAEDDLEEAYAMAVEHGHELVAMGAARGLTFVIGARQAQYEQGLQWGVTALALAKRQADEVYLALVLTAFGLVLTEQGKLEDALDHHRRALEIYQRSPSSDHLVALTLTNLGEVLHALGRLDEAQDHYQQALAMQKDVLGPGHPHIGLTLDGLGVVLQTRGELEKAAEQHGLALSITEQALGSSHPDVAVTLLNLGSVALRRGELGEAVGYYRRALAIQESALGSDYPDTAATLANLGAVLQMQGSYDEALGYYKRALAVEKRVRGAAHASVGETMHNIGTLLDQQGRLDEALEYQQQALEIFERALGADHPHVAYPLTNMGVVLQRQGKLEKALEHQRRALTILERAFGPENPKITNPLSSIGVILEQQGKLDEALMYHQRALSVSQASLGPDDVSVASSLVNIARIELMQRLYDAACAHAERAVEIRESNEVDPRSLAKARLVLAEASWYVPDKRSAARDLARTVHDTYVELSETDSAEYLEVKRWLDAHDGGGKGIAKKSSR